MNSSAKRKQILLQELQNRFDAAMTDLREQEKKIMQDYDTKKIKIMQQALRGSQPLGDQTQTTK